MEEPGVEWWEGRGLGVEVHELLGEGDEMVQRGFGVVGRGGDWE